MKAKILSRGGRALYLAIAVSAITASAAGAATVLTITPTSANFGNVKVGNNSAPKGFTLTLDCTITVISCSATFDPSVTASGDFAALSGCPATMTASHGLFSEGAESCFIAASFIPAAAGARSGVLSTGTGGPTATLSGTGVVDPVVPTQATLGKCKKGGKKKSASAAKKKCKKKKKK